MDCMRSFSLRISFNEIITGTGIAKIWGLANQNSFIGRLLLTPSTFTIQGFKNINIYKIEAVGRIESPANSSYSCLVQDWNVYMQITGQNGTIGGVVGSPNLYGIIQEINNPEFSISKYNPCVTLESPITSARTITITAIDTQGINAQDLTTLQLKGYLTFNFYYDFESE